MSTYHYTCIVCPMGCRLILEDNGSDFAVTGHTCKRGEVYAISERTAPKRMLTTTVRLENSSLVRLPIISSTHVPKEKIRDCLEILYGMAVCAPVSCGDVVVRDIAGTGVDIVAARSAKSNDDEPKNREG